MQIKPTPIHHFAPTEMTNVGRWVSPRMWRSWNRHVLKQKCIDAGTLESSWAVPQKSWTWLLRDPKILLFGYLPRWAKITYPHKFLGANAHRSINHYSSQTEGPNVQSVMNKQIQCSMSMQDRIRIHAATRGSLKTIVLSERNHTKCHISCHLGG